MFVPSDQYSGGEPLPERPKIISIDLKQAFIVAVATAGFGMFMAQGAKISGPYMMPSRITIKQRDFRQN